MYSTQVLSHPLPLSISSPPFYSPFPLSLSLSSTFPPSPGPHHPFHLFNFLFLSPFLYFSNTPSLQLTPIPV